MDIPIVRLEIQRMKHTICTALAEHSAKMDSDIQKAIEDFCTEENIDRVIREATYKILDCTIREEVEAFFRYGPGRNVIAAAVKEKLLTNKSFSPLDH